MLLEEAGNGTQVGTESAEFPGAVKLLSTHDPVPEDLFTRFLLHPGKATVENGLVERLQVFECRHGPFICCLAKVLEEPPVGGAPGLGVSLAKPPTKIFAQKRMSIQRTGF